jgi:hypothetical protein
MEFVDAVRLVYNLANGMELTLDEATCPLCNARRNARARHWT